MKVREARRGAKAGKRFWGAPNIPAVAARERFSGQRQRAALVTMRSGLAGGFCLFVKPLIDTNANNGRDVLATNPLDWIE